MASRKFKAYYVETTAFCAVLFVRGKKWALYEDGFETDLYPPLEEYYPMEKSEYMRDVLEEEFTFKMCDKWDIDFDGERNDSHGTFTDLDTFFEKEFETVMYIGEYSE
jgi:hypothetical protein